MIELHVNAQTGEETFVETPDPVLTLDEAKLMKKAQITQSYQDSIQTFTSSALGSAHTYLADNVSMPKLNGEYTFVNSPAYDNSQINWFTVEAGGVVHTVAQFNQVWLDGRNAMAASFNKWDSKIKEIDACTDVPSVQTITW